MSWWDWDRWQQEIDWMALHGINMPLAITGEEYTWYQVYHKMGFADKELKDFFSGPAYFASVLDGQPRRLGRPPVHALDGISKRIAEKDPDPGKRIGNDAGDASLHRTRPRLLPLPLSVGALQIHQLEERLQGHRGYSTPLTRCSPTSASVSSGNRPPSSAPTISHSADTFNENEPPSDDPAFLSGLSKKIFEGMQQADPHAVWVMQGWLFYSDRKFWKAPQIQGAARRRPQRQNGPPRPGRRDRAGLATDKRFLRQTVGLEYAQQLRR
ncbi:alpha-N-acetylglucosaminidase TIM-barrel domain-containing protein [Puia sp. P3]|uniref:alpha-N-acetylglucosaminidase TIM-barrel domain-containing protein n=1 Tax=Puia sp. P3 TaxID=3423952 RepID=UPI003D668154